MASLADDSAVALDKALSHCTTAVTTREDDLMVNAPVLRQLITALISMLKAGLLATIAELRKEILELRRIVE